MTNVPLRFDDVIDVARKTLGPYVDILPEGTLLNLDLSARVRLVVPSQEAGFDSIGLGLQSIAEELSDALYPHSFPADQMILWEEDLELARHGTHVFPLLDSSEKILVADRLIHGSSWSQIRAVSGGTPRLIFFSLKGGVGRSTALAALAWHLSSEGRRVLAVDLDLESPGISTFLLPPEQQPSAGLVDWLVEDLVDRGDDVLPDVYSLSPSAPGAEIIVVPAHGTEPGPYISKLGRAWMAKGVGGDQERWEKRLDRLLTQLEDEHQPDVVLIDSRSGLDDVASNAIAALGAQCVMLFATDDRQTWQGYGSLFRHWQATGVAKDVRERLHVVAALVPEEDPAGHMMRVRDASLDLFERTLYDEVEGDQVTGEEDLFSFTRDDEAAPHFPWEVRWNRGLRSLRTLSASFDSMDDVGIEHVFGPLLAGVDELLRAIDDSRWSG